MNKRSVFSILSVLCFAALMLGLAVLIFSPEAIAAYASTGLKHLAPGGNSNPFTTSLTATNAISDVNNYAVALVIQTGQNQLQAFSALTGEWATLGGTGMKVRPDDVAIASKLLILVAQPGQDQLHAFSALTGQWATLSGPEFKVQPEDLIKVNDTVIIVAQPAQDQLHAFSALTGEWATLSGPEFKVSPDDKILVGTEQ